MKRKIEIRSIDAKGTSKIISGQDDSPHKQRAAFNTAKLNPLPKGVVRVEMWECVRETAGLPAPTE